MAKHANRFSFASLPTISFGDRTKFLKGMSKWLSHRQHVDAADVEAVTIDGELVGTDYRMTQSAFSDLCRVSGVPERFIKGLAGRNEALAIEVLQDACSAGLLGGHLLLVDTESNCVDGIVREDRYNPPDVYELVKVASSFSRDTRFLGGWINGSSVRITATDGPLRDVKTTKKAKVGDLVGLGFELVTDIGPTGRTVVTDYIERLSCLNGMTSRGSEARVERDHEGFNLDTSLLRCLVEATHGATAMLEMANRASQHFFDADGIREVKSLIADAAHPASSEDLAKHATQVALVEAKKDSRTAGEICLWDFVNGVTDAAKHAATLEGRQRIEDFGFVVMHHVLASE